MKNKLIAILLFIASQGYSQNWDEVIKLVSSDRQYSVEEFGVSVCIDGDKAIVGAEGQMFDAFGTNFLSKSGAAYILHYDGSSWIEEAKLVASDRGEGDRFGRSVSISGNRAVVGAYKEEEDAFGQNTINTSGSAYVFYYDGSSWIEEAKLVASDRAWGDRFGNSVSISGNRAVVGAYWKGREGGPIGDNTGAAYVFNFDGSQWIEEAKLVASDRPDGGWVDANFGHSVSISGNNVIVGAPYSEVESERYGNAYIFSFDGNSWSESARFLNSASDAIEYGGEYGKSVSINGNQAIVGAPKGKYVYGIINQFGEEEIITEYYGYAYVYQFNGSSWVLETKLEASDKKEWSDFGESVSISGDRAIVSAPNHDADWLDDPNPGEYTAIYADAGASYVFRKDEESWIEEEILTASDKNIGDGFGRACFISADNRVIVSSLNNDDTTYIYHYKDCPTISPPSGSLFQNFCEGSTIEDLIAIGTEIKWYDSATEGNLLSPSTLLNSGFTYYASQTENNCESQSTLAVSVTVTNSNTVSETVTECDSYTWNTNGQTYTQSGQYTEVLTNQGGCDSTVILNLTITNSNTVSETVTECDSYTWNINGQTYTQSGQYTEVLTNQNGCDSSVTLDLTINSSSSSIQSDTGLDSYTWSLNNQTYTQSGTYTAVIPNASGCDSTITLNLTLEFITGIGENQTPSFSVYPNPTSNSFTISSERANNSGYKLMDVKGRVVLTGIVESSEQIIDISSLPTGIYSVVFEQQDLPVLSIVKE